MTDVGGEITRDRWGRPLVVPPEGGKAVPYTRVTTFIDVLEEKRALNQWMQRMVAIGLTERPDLLIAASAHRGDKAEMNRLCEEAIEAAKGRAAATTGTALHALTEQVDRGFRLPPLPGDAQRDVDAYRRATAGMEMLAIESFVVNDELRAAGTPDRIVSYGGRNYIADIKTGDIKYGAGKIAMQLALYSRSVHYDHRTHARVPLPDVDQTRGIVIHLPAGEGVCELHWVDLIQGWDGVELAREVREWRSRKGFMTTIDGNETPVDDDAADIESMLRNAESVGALNQIWRDHRDRWTDQHTAMAAERKAQLMIEHSETLFENVKDNAYGYKPV